MWGGEGNINRAVKQSRAFTIVTTTFYSSLPQDNTGTALRQPSSPGTAESALFVGALCRDAAEAPPAMTAATQHTVGDSWGQGCEVGQRVWVAYQLATGLLPLSVELHQQHPIHLPLPML